MEAEKLQAKKVTIAQKQYDMIDSRIMNLDREWHQFAERQRQKAMEESKRLAGGVFFSIHIHIILSVFLCVNLIFSCH